jgi:arylsulfatase A-like enzyme
MINGTDFHPGKVRQDCATVVDIAPTILAHLGQRADGMDGSALQERLRLLRTDSLVRQVELLDGKVDD